MKTRFISSILSLVFFSIFENGLFGQNESISIRFLKASFTDTIAGKGVVAVFLVSTKDTSNFPPEIIIPPRCTVFEDGREKVVILNPNTLSVSMDGDKIAKKNPSIYTLIKDVIYLDSLQTSIIITYKLKGLNYNFKKMSLTPAFKEKRNQAIRVEKRCEFEVQ